MSEEPITSIASACISCDIDLRTRSGGTCSPKNTTSGFNTPPHCAGRHLKAREIALLDVGVAVRRLQRIKVGPARIEAHQFSLQIPACMALLAAHAAHLVDPAVQVDHVRAAGGLVQPIDVLRDQLHYAILLLQMCQGAMRVVGQRGAQAAPADQAARPVALLRARLAHEVLKHDRSGPFPAAVGVAVVRDSGFSAAAGTGQNEQAGIALDELPQSMIIHAA